MIKITFLMLLLFSSSIPAFTLSYLPHSKFDNPEITVNVTGDDCSAIGHTSESFLDFIIDVADEFWNSVSSSKIHLKKGAVISVSFDALTTTNTASNALALVPDNTILVGCNTSSFSSNSTLGAGQITPASSTRRGYFMLNVGGNYLSSSEGQKRATIAHELGHSIGIGHSSDEGALMYYSLSGKLQEHLGMDDLDAVSYLYPHDKAPGSCGTIQIVKPSSGMLTTIVFLIFGMIYFSKRRSIS